jgi:hypothetical protein
MQFLYTLEGGKKRRTEGTLSLCKSNSSHEARYDLNLISPTTGHIIHQALEKELHETITFQQITTPEETWALRFLNILFGLRELQFQGMTVFQLKTQLIIRENFVSLGLLKDIS